MPIRYWDHGEGLQILEQYVRGEITAQDASTLSGRGVKAIQSAASNLRAKMGLQSSRLPRPSNLDSAEKAYSAIRTAVEQLAVLAVREKMKDTAELVDHLKAENARLQEVNGNLKQEIAALRQTIQQYDRIKAEEILQRAGGNIKPS